MLALLSVAVTQQQTVQAQENWRDSLTAINKQIAQSSWSTDLHLRKANANLQLKQWQYAVDEYGLVLLKEPHNPAALFYRAYAYTHLRRFDLARNDLSDLLIVLPHHFEARLSMAVVQQQLGRKQDALDHLNQAIQQCPDSAVAYAARANLDRTRLRYTTGRKLRNCRRATQRMWYRTSTCCWCWNVVRKHVVCSMRLSIVAFLAACC